MTHAKNPNALVMQSGGPTPVLNRSLLGVVSEASQSGAFGKIYGARHGLEGFLATAGPDSDLIDLNEVSDAQWKRIARTPGAALGSTRRKLRPEDYSPLFESLSRHEIRFLLLIGGNDSAETGHAISLRSRASGYDLTVMLVPKTIDNDLAVTDHSPGYGSAARFVALATMGAGRDAEAMRHASPITVIEVMGRDAGWLAAASALARREERDAPHLICLPEVPVDETRFLELIEDTYRRLGYAVAVVAENARGPDGVLGGRAQPRYVDDFGHPYFDGAGQYLAELASRRLGVRVRCEKPGTIQRSMMTCVSTTDAREAEMAGRAAVRYALDGHTDRMVALERPPEGPYRCTTRPVPLQEVAGRVKTIPREYLDPANYFPAKKFLEYARPLVGKRMPRLGRLG